MINPLRRNILRTIKEYEMFTPGDKVLIGASGGPDSMALVHMLYSLADEFEIVLGICYLNHGLRPTAAEKEAAFVQTIAAALNLACHLGKIHIEMQKGSLEERARTARYEFFHKTAQAHGYTKVAVAHQAEDNAEAVLMHLLRGSGLRGLSGIPPMGPGGIVRPLINCRRTDIMAYLNDNRLSYMIDESNADLCFMRNRIRHLLIPLLERQYNPKVIETLNRTADLCRQEEQWLQHHTMPMLAEAVAFSNEQGFGLHADKLARMDRPFQRRLIREALKKRQGHIKRLSGGHVEAILSLLDDGHRRRSIHLPLGVVVERTAHTLSFSTTATPRGFDKPEPPATYYYSISSPAQLPQFLRIPEADCRLRFSLATPCTLPPSHPPESKMVWLDLKRLCFPLIIRGAEAGDRIQPFGMSGTQKIKELFINRKIPRNQRNRIPLIISDRDIIWAVGLRRGATAPLSATTTRVLRIEIIEENAEHPPGC